LVIEVCRSRRGRGNPTTGESLSGCEQSRAGWPGDERRGRRGAAQAHDTLPRFRATFEDIQVVELPEIKHFFLEDESPTVADAIVNRFG
jgi:hypothetical protein